MGGPATPLPSTWSLVRAESTSPMVLTVLHGTDGGDGGEEGEGEYAIRLRLESNWHIEKHEEKYAIMVLWNAG